MEAARANPIRKVVTMSVLVFMATWGWALIPFYLDIGAFIPLIGFDAINHFLSQESSVFIVSFGSSA